MFNRYSILSKLNIRIKAILLKNIYHAKKLSFQVQRIKES